jgi:hypothetical protein
VEGIAPSRFRDFRHVSSAATLRAQGATLSADEETRMAEPLDWRLEQTERALNRLERQGFAWEFLRRNPDYRSEYDSLHRTPISQPGATSRQRSTAPQWGLRFPDRSRSIRS